MKPASHESGFTLIEVMIALMIFAMIAAAGVAILSFSVRAGAATTVRLDDAAGLDRTLALLSSDLAQAVNRPARDESGAVRPAFTGDAATLMLVRAGWTNLDGSPRAGLQKVGYVLAGGALQRIAYPMVDSAAPLAPATLMKGIGQLHIRYRTAGAWSDQWDGSAIQPLPDAVELVLARGNGTAYRSLMLVGTGYIPSKDAAGAP